MKNLSLVLLVSLTLAITTTHANTIHVPADQPSIQAGINAAVIGDTVLVHPGIYYENINFNGKDILVSSLFLTTQERQYINSTIIDGNRQESVVRFYNNETRDAEIYGFTLQNGSGHSYLAYSFKPVGGGVSIKYSNPSISFCAITNNMACVGGGIYCLVGSFKLKGSIVMHNHAYSFRGGGIFMNSETAPIEFDTVYLNSIYCNFASEGNDIYSGFNQPVHFELDIFSIANPEYDYFYI